MKEEVSARFIMLNEIFAPFKEIVRFIIIMLNGKILLFTSFRCSLLSSILLFVVCCCEGIQFITR